MNQETLTQDHPEDVIDSLAHDVTSPEDAKTLAEWDREEALKAMGQTAMPELVQRQDGTVTTADAIAKERAEGQGDSGPYGTGSRA